MTQRVVGIDIGTSSCSVALVIDGEPRVLPVFDGYDEMPTYVAFARDGTRLVGWPAKRQAVTNPANTIFTVKRLIGRKWAHAGTEAELGLLPYRVKSSAAGTLWIEAAGRTYTPTEITAIMLGEVKRAAEAYLGHPVTQAVVTVPARFDLGQVRATVDAAEIAGIEVLREVAEPVAAAFAYGFSHGGLKGPVAVYDLGGGTFDVSILVIEDGVFEVKSVNGDNRLGGEDFDHLLVEFFVKQIRRDHGIDLASNALALHRIKEASERVKIELDSIASVTASLPYLTTDKGEVFNAELKISRSEIEELFEPLISRTILPCRTALHESGETKVERLILVGGMSRMPAIRARVSEFFEITPHQHLDPSRIVAFGAAIQAAVLEGAIRDQLLLDVNRLSLGLELPDGTFVSIIGSNVMVPTIKEIVLGTGDGDRECDVTFTPAEWSAFAKQRNVKIVEGDPKSKRNRLTLFDRSLDLRKCANDAGAILGITLDIDANMKTRLTIRRLADRSLLVANERLEAGNPFGDQQTFSAEDLASARARADELLNRVDGMVKDGYRRIDPSPLAALGDARTDLERAMQSRDFSALSQAISELERRSRLTAERRSEPLPPPVAIDVEAASDASIFISYSRADYRWLERLLVHLKPLIRDHRVVVWHDGKIEPGDAWKREIDEALSKASTAILLVSANFLASDFIYANELPPILDRHRRGGMKVIPVIVSNSQFEVDPALSGLGAFNDPKIPLSALRRAAAEAELARLARLLRRMAAGEEV